MEKYSELWEIMNKSVPLLVIIFEEGIESLVGAQVRIVEM